MGSDLKLMESSIYWVSPKQFLGSQGVSDGRWRLLCVLPCVVNWSGIPNRFPTYWIGLLKFVCGYTGRGPVRLWTWTLSAIVYAGIRCEQEPHVSHWPQHRLASGRRSDNVQSGIRQAKMLDTSPLPWEFLSRQKSSPVLHLFGGPTWSCGAPYLRPNNSIFKFL